MAGDRPKIGVLSLGCPRNLVDTEVMCGYLTGAGYELVDIEAADIGIVVTCAFIEDAKKESIDSILGLLELKKTGHLRAVLVAGCLSQRYGEALSEELKGVDVFLGCDDIPAIARIVSRIASGPLRHSITPIPSYIYTDSEPRSLITPSHYAYVKISEGCSHRCSFCVIPSIKGPHRSRPMESIIREVKALCARGAIREIVIIGQDTTAYGSDLYGKPSLPRLLRKIDRVTPDAVWIRVLYTHPARIDDEFIETFAQSKKICHYIDVSIQHASDRVLTLMNRRCMSGHVRALIDRIRCRIPEAVLRTSVIVGFPGESDDDFRVLHDFIRDVEFERLGVFLYSAEEGTPAYGLPARVPEAIQRERFDILMRTQQEIASAQNRKLLGTVRKVLLDELCSEPGMARGRTYGDAPEVDGEVFVRGHSLAQGEFCMVRITDTMEYDLSGEKVET